MIQGYLHPDFWPVARVLEKQVDASGGGGAAVCIYHRGEPVVDIWSGRRSRNGTPWEGNTLALSFSTTKGVTSTAFHILVEKGLVDYEDTVAEHWPEFAQNGKADITIRQLLCHEAGLYPIRQHIDDASRMLDWEYMTRALAAAAPCFDPGTANGYHALTFGWLVGELIQRIAGKPYTEVIEAEIAKPLDLDGLFVGLPESERYRAAEFLPAWGDRMPGEGRDGVRILRQARRFFSWFGLPIDPVRMADALAPPGIADFDWNATGTIAAPIPAANGMFTARSLARMYAMLAGRGELDGVRLLSTSTLAQATEVQNRRIDRVVPFPMHWRLGYHRVASLRGTIPNAFGHFGFGGSGAWADPERNLSVALTLNSGAGSPFGDLRILRINGAAVNCADRR